MPWPWLYRKEEVMEYTNSSIKAVIEEYIHKEKHRQLLLRRYIDGICFEPLAEEFDLSVRQTKNIVYKYEPIIFKHLKGE